MAYVAHVFGFLAGAVIGLFIRAASPPPPVPGPPSLSLRSHASKVSCVSPAEQDEGHAEGERGQRGHAHGEAAVSGRA